MLNKNNTFGFSKIAKFLLVMIISSLFMTCDPGLGKAVDTQAPKVSIEYPATKSVLKGGFTMKGVASDEVKVASCVVSFKNIKNSKEYKFNATVANDEFTVNINTQNTDGSFPLPDGDYNVTVTVSDAYRNSTADVVYTVDNTSPTVLLTNPNAYIESNWPDMYKAISIKGEVYDATTISEVRVFIVDKDGKEVISQVADGTNTFNANFSNLSDIVDGEYFYYAVAKDAGGNINTYCYHKYDIFELLSNKVENAESAEKTIIFPSINSIGYVDQGLDSSIIEGIDATKLNSKKIANKKLDDGKPILTKGNYPGFNYYAKDTAKVKWLNITDDGNAGIGIGSPVLGTIMPPTDGSAIKYDSVKVYLEKSEDSATFSGFPTEENESSWANGTTKWILSSSTAKVGEEGEKQVKLTAVGESLNFQIDSHPVGNEVDNWYSGYYKVKISFSTTTLNAASECIFTVTSGAPKITENSLSEQNPHASYYRGYMTAKTKADGKNYLIGQVKTSDGASLLPLSYTYLKTGDLIENSGSVDVPSMTNEEYSIEIPINTETHENDGEYTYTLKAEVATLSTVISRVVVVDTINPVITLNTLENNKVLDTRTCEIRGNVDDANGIEKIEYQLFADDSQILADGTSATDWTVIEGSKSSLSLLLTNLTINKTYTLKLRATDAAGNVNGDDDYTYTFTVDKELPTITTTVSPQIMYDNGSGEELTVNGTIKVNVKVSDSNKLSAVYYTTKSAADLADNANWSSEGSFSQTELSAGKTIELDTTKFTDKTKLPLRIKAVDAAENYKIEVVEPVINQESDKPRIGEPKTIEDLDHIDLAGWSAIGGKNVFGSSNPNVMLTLSDDDSVKEYYVSIDGGNFVKVADVNASQKTMTYSVADLAFGRHSITFRIIDSNYISNEKTPNSFVEKTYYIAIGDGAPFFNLNNEDGQFVGSSFEISGKVEDKNGIDSITLQSASGNDYATLNLGNGLTEDNSNSYSFSYMFNVPEIKESIIITAFDKLGRSNVIEFSYLVDTVAPTVNLVEEKIFVDGNTPQGRVTGTAYDNDQGEKDNGVSKIDHVKLKIGSDVTDVNDLAAFTASGNIIDGLLTWSYVLDFTDEVSTNPVVYVCAFDKAGNKSSSKTIDVSIDKDVPQITHDYDANDIGSKTGEFTIEGYATDSSGISSVNARIQGQNANLTYSEFDPYTGKWSFTVPSDTDGSLVIVVTATDNSKKTASVNLTAKLDSKNPEIEFLNIEQDGSTKQTNTVPNVTVAYSDETSGVATFEYKFYYKGNDYADFVDYSEKNQNAAGIITLGSTSGNFKINMASRTSGSNKEAFIDQTSDTDGIWKLWYRAVDGAGHEIEDYSPEFIVDRHAPDLEVDNLQRLRTEGDSLSVSGNVVDNYGGTIDKVTVAVVHNKYTQSQLDSFKKTFTLDDGLEYNDSEKHYKWSVTWDETNSPFIYSNEYQIIVTAYDIAENHYESKNTVSCDNTAPGINFVKPYSYSVASNGKITSGSVVNSPIGQTSVSASIAETNGMKGLFYQIGGTVNLSTEGTIGTENYKITNISVENGGIQNTTEENVFNNPNEANGDIKAGFLTGIWKKHTDANNGFALEIDTLKYFTDGKTKELLDNNSDNDKNVIQTLELHLVAYDEAGNINYCAMPIKVDTDTDKPELLLLSPKTTDVAGVKTADVGGATTISGTVSDDNSVHSVWVNLELVNGNYNSDGLLVGNSQYGGSDSTSFYVDYSDSGKYGEGSKIQNPQSITVNETDKIFTLNDNDTQYFASKNKWYKVNIGAEDEKSTTWSLILNNYSEFDIAGELKKYFATDKYDAQKETTLKIRVIALDKKTDDDALAKSKLSDITEFTLNIDSGSPSIVITNIDSIPTEGSYIGGVITYNVTFSDDTNIAKWNVSVIGNRGTTQIAGNDSENAKSISEKIELNTEEINNQCGNVITLKFYAEDDAKNASGDLIDAKSSEETFKYIIDNSAPVASVAEKIDNKEYLIATESVIGDATGAHRETDERGNHLRIKSQSALLSGKISDEINGSGIDYVMLFFTKDSNVYNPGNADDISTCVGKISVKDSEGNSQEIDIPVASLANISRKKVNGNTTPYIIIDKAEGLLDNGSNGDGDGYDENLKANGEWMVSIDSTNLGDGVYIINYLVVDIAGNVRYYTDSMLVQNDAPIITSIVLATDIDGDGYCEADISGENDEAQKFDSSTKFDTSSFIVRNNLLNVRINETGGKHPLKYYLTYKNSQGEETTVKSEQDADSHVFTITDFPEDGITNYSIMIEDTVEPNLSLSSGVKSIELIIDNIDDVKPVAQFFELNTSVESSKTANQERGSLYKENSLIKGHIEPRDYSLFDNESVADPDVSGTIILRGEAYDNQRIGSIKLYLPGAAGGLEVATWQNDTLVASQGATIINDLGLNGHHVEWSYVFDTSLYTQSNAEVYIEVKDATQNLNESIEFDSIENTPRTDKNKFNTEGWGYNYMTVDIVPYITKIETPNRTLSGLKNNNIRSASGKYSVIKGSTSDFIKVSGFNLAATSVKLVNSTQVKSTVDNTTGESLSFEPIVEPYNQLYLSNDSDVSGYLEIFVNEIRSINNLNDNTQEYNQEPDESTKNRLLNDDRYLRFFSMKDTGVKNGFYPTMLMEGDDPVFGYLDLKGGPKSNIGITEVSDDDKTTYYGVDNGGAGIYNADHAMPQRAKFNGEDGSVKYKEYLIKASIWDQMGMARDESGRYYHATLYNRSGAYFHFIYDRFAELYEDGEAWGRGVTYSGFDESKGGWAPDSGNNVITLEDVNYGNGLMLGRYQYPKLIARGNSVTGSASIYQLYYDANTTNNELIFRNFKVGNEGDYSLFLGGIASDDGTYSQVSTLADNNGPETRIVAATGASNHFSFDVSGEGRVVIVYYDETLGRLVMRVSETSINGSNPYASRNFETSSIIFPDYVGSYVSMCLDSAGGVHISALDSSDSDLVYIYVDHFLNSSYKMVVVDQASAVGNWTQIKLKDGVPHIAYYNATEAGGKESIKLAYANSAITSVATVVAGVDSDGYTTGNWEYMTVPAITAPQGGKSEFQNVCLDFDSSGKPVVGYLGSNLEFGSWCDEKY